MPSTSGTQAVNAGAVTALVLGAFVLPYQVSVTTSWNTSVAISGKTLTQFLVTFGTPAPAGGGTIDWLVVSAALTTPPPPPLPAGVSDTLSTYLTRTRRLLHDLPANYVPDPANTTPTQYFSDFDLTADINDAVNQRDLWSGGSRSYQPNVPLVVGQDTYPFATLFPNLVVLDVLSVYLIYGATRVGLENPTFTDLTIKARSLTGYQNRPWGFVRYGAGSVVIAPAPSTPYTADFDLSVLSTTLVNVADSDPLRFPYTRPVPFYAAYSAKLNQRRYDEAEVFFGYFVRAMRDIEGARVGQLLTSYTETRSRSRTGY